MKYWHFSLKFVKYFLTALFIETAALVALTSADLYLTGHHLAAVETGSMVPTFQIGDAVISKKVTAAQVSAGDIISYVNPKSPSQMISHRVVSVDTKAAILVTKGDHLRQADTAIGNGAVRGKVIAVVPKLGYVINTVRNIYSLSIICSLLLLLAGYEIYHFGQQRYRHVYRLSAYKIET